MRVDRGARNGRHTLKTANHSVLDTQEAEEMDPDTTLKYKTKKNLMDVQELIDSEYHRRKEGSDIAPVSTKGVQLLVKFFGGERA